MYAGDGTVFGGSNNKGDKICSVELSRQTMIKDRQDFEVIGKILGEKESSFRVYLTPLLGKADTYANWINDPSISSMLGRANKVVTIGDQEDFMEYCSGKPYFDIRISEGSCIKHIGVCNLVVMEDGSHHAIIGIHIGDKKWHGKGVGTAAIEMLLEIAFNRMNLNCVSLTVVEDNKSAIKCYTKCGFKEQGIQRDRAYINGQYKNLVYMDITKLEYNYFKNKNKECDLL